MTSSGTHYRVFAVCAPGLEAPLADELRELLGKQKLQRRRGGMELRLPADGLWRLVHGSRLAEGVRVRLGDFQARHWDALAKGLGKLPSHAYVRGESDVRVTARKSKLIHTDAIRDRVTKALGIRQASATGTALKLWVRVVKDQVTISVDAAGPHLYRRGYRTHVGKAPLRETLAAALVRLASPPDAVSSVWDPFCGSGTVLLEAAQDRAGGWVRGADHVAAFTRWPSHSTQRYSAWCDAMDGEAPVGGSPLTLFGSDISADELTAAASNADRAGASVRWAEGDFDAVVDDVPEGSAVISNLPYGVRSGKHLSGVFRRFGAMLKRRPDLGPITVISGYRDFEAATGLQWEILADTDNRGLKVKVLKLSR